jgi:hypothetical protein
MNTSRLSPISQAQNRTDQAVPAFSRLLITPDRFISKSFRCAKGVPHASSRYELSRAFSIPIQKCYRAGFFWGNRLKRMVSAERMGRFNLIVDPEWNLKRRDYPQ